MLLPFAHECTDDRLLPLSVSLVPQARSAQLMTGGGELCCNAGESVLGAYRAYTSGNIEISVFRATHGRRGISALHIPEP